MIVLGCSATPTTPLPDWLADQMDVRVDGRIAGFKSTRPWCEAFDATATEQLAFRVTCPTNGKTYKHEIWLHPCPDDHYERPPWTHFHGDAFEPRAWVTIGAWLRDISLRQANLRIQITTLEPDGRHTSCDANVVVPLEGTSQQTTGDGVAVETQFKELHQQRSNTALQATGRYAARA